MSILQLRSSNSDVTVVFSDVEGDYFRITVSAHDHSAARGVYAYTDAHGIARLFAEAARDWKGWEGVKDWESLEGELRLALTTDRLGHVVLGLRICSDPGGADPWELKADIGLDAGQLETIAREAEDLFHRAG